MYFIVYIKDHTGWLIFWGLQLNEFDFEVKYKNVKANTQANALSRRNYMSEKIPNKNGGHIPLYHLDQTNLEL